MFDQGRREPWSSFSDMPHGPRELPDPRGGPTSPGAPRLVQVSAPHWYAQIISASFPVAQISQKLLDQSGSWRNMLAIRNSSATANVFVGFGTDASLTASWLRLAAGDIILFDTVVPQDDLYFIADAVAATIALGYSTTNR